MSSTTARLDDNVFSCHLSPCSRPITAAGNQLAWTFGDTVASALQAWSATQTYDINVSGGECSLVGSLLGRNVHHVSRFSQLSPTVVTMILAWAEFIRPP